jgi:hypothetical protein
MKAILSLVIGIFSLTTFANANQHQFESLGHKIVEPIQKDECTQKQMDQAQIEKCEKISKDQDQSEDQSQDQSKDQDQDQSEDQAQDQSKDQADQSQDQGQDQGQYAETETVRWINFGEFKTSKSHDSYITLHLHGAYLNEISLESRYGTTQVHSVTAYLTNGEIVDITPFTDSAVSDGNVMRVRASQSHPLMVDKLVLNVSASRHHFFSKRERVIIHVGLAR